MPDEFFAVGTVLARAVRRSGEDQALRSGVAGRNVPVGVVGGDRDRERRTCGLGARSLRREAGGAGRADREHCSGSIGDRAVCDGDGRCTRLVEDHDSIAGAEIVATPLENVMAVGEPKVVAVPLELVTVGLVLFGLGEAPPKVRLCEPV